MEFTYESPKSRTRKKKRSAALRTKRTPRSHQVAELGKRSVKQRRGWSNRKANVSFFVEPVGESLKRIQIINRSKHGKPVFLPKFQHKVEKKHIGVREVYPTMMRKAPMRSGKTASLKEMKESGVRVYPTIRTSREMRWEGEFYRDH